MKIDQEDLNLRLERAAQHNDAQGALYFLALGADPNAKPRIGSQRIIERAIEHGNATIVAALARHGLDLNSIPGVVGTPLTMCASRGKLGCAKALLDAGADPNGAEDLAGWTPLARALAQGEVEAMSFLIERGARWEARPVIKRLAKEQAKSADHVAALALLEALELRRETPRAKPAAGPRL